MSSNFFRNHLDTFSREILEQAEKEGSTTSLAAAKVIAGRFRYDVEEENDVNFTDGSGDRGIDFWHASDNALYIYQVKTHKFTDQGFINPNIKFNNEGITDLIRAKNFLLHEDEMGQNHKKLAKVKTVLNRLIRNRKAKYDDINSNEQKQRSLQNDPLNIYLYLIILGESLTDPAFDELANFEASLKDPVEFDGGYIQFSLGFQTISDIVKAAWQEENREWKDINGNIKEKIALTPMKHSQGHTYLSDNKSAIFYCRAIDLIQAYEDLGYKIFEPNVRAQIKKSRINDAIYESASKSRSMKEFRFLNNGITITCDNYSTPSGQRDTFFVTRPGIVNGLQTVTALARAYRDLPGPKKDEFVENCYVFVRLLRTDAVQQISEVVLATNNQNTMEPRNLKSNSEEQVNFAKYFADELGWFYESKEGAWEAFDNDPSRWRPRIRRKPKAFKSSKNRLKRMDNLDLAQNWLAFLGFADNARQDKKRLFDSDKNYYDLIFLSRPHKHAFTNYNSINDALKDCDKDAPDPNLMLAAHVTRLFVSKIVPTAQQNKKAALEAAIEKGEILEGRNLSIDEEARILNKDSEFILNQALNAMSLVFVEFVGFTLFKILGEDVHRFGHAILKTQSWNALAFNLDWQVAIDKIGGMDKNLAADDLLVIIWLFFRSGVKELMAGEWNEPYRTNRYRTDFLLSQRRRLYEKLLEMDEGLKRRRGLPWDIWWLNEYQDGDGIFGHLERVTRKLILKM